jgi:hypothetical protein
MYYYMRLYDHTNSAIFRYSEKLPLVLFTLFFLLFLLFNSSATTTILTDARNYLIFYIKDERDDAVDPEKEQ